MRCSEANLSYLQIKGIICGLGKDGFAIIAALIEVLRLPRQDMSGDYSHPLSERIDLYQSSLTLLISLSSGKLMSGNITTAISVETTYPLPFVAYR